MDNAYDAGPHQGFHHRKWQDSHRRSEQAAQGATGALSRREATVQDPLDRRTVQCPPEGLAGSSKDHGQGEDRTRSPIA